MKKVFILLGLAAISSAVAVGVSTKASFKQAKADPDPETAITMNSSFFSNHKAIGAENWEDGFDETAGTFGDENSIYWTPNENFSFNSMGSFFRGESNEGWRGVLKSRTWSQVTECGYFTWSAQNNSDNVYIEFFYDNGAGHNGSIKLKNNAYVENTMMLWYFKIPSFVSASTYTMHVELYDDSISDFAFNNFGYLHVNQTEEQVSDAMRWYLNHLNYYNSGNDGWNNTDRNKRSTIFNHYYGNSYLKAVFCKTVSNVDEDFSSNDNFLKHWSFDWAYDNFDRTAKHFDTIISTYDNRPDDGHNVPFNNNGGFFKGWYADNTNNSGFTGTDGAIYRFRSRAFVLNNLGLISIKMGGRAASLHVIDVETNSILAWVNVDGRSYQASGDIHDIAESGFNTCTMRRFVVNLEAYAGRTIQLALADIYNEGWAAAYFDELVTSYSNINTFKFSVDEVAQTNSKEVETDVFQNVTSYSAYTDYYVSSRWVDGVANGIAYDSGNDINKANDNAILNHVDNSAANEAFEFLKWFYQNFRSDTSFNYLECSNFAGQLQKLCDDYSGLSASAKAIVDNSDDFNRGSVVGNYYRSHVNTTNTVGAIVTAIIVNNHLTPTDNGSSSNFFFAKNENNIGLIIVISISALTLLGFAVLFAKKKKQN